MNFINCYIKGTVKFTYVKYCLWESLVTHTHALLTAVLIVNNGELHVPAALPQDKKVQHNMNWLTIGLSSRIDQFENREASCLRRESKHDPLDVRPVA